MLRLNVLYSRRLTRLTPHENRCRHCRRVMSRRVRSRPADELKERLGTRLLPTRLLRTRLLITRLLACSSATVHDGRTREEPVDGIAHNRGEGPSSPHFGVG